MFDKLFKKQAKLPEVPTSNGEDAEDQIELPEVDDTLAKVDEALAKADALEKAEKVKKENDRKAREATARREREEIERNAGGRCGCGW